MAHYVVLGTWTEQGVANYRDTLTRADAFTGLVQRHGGELTSLRWTLGAYDLVAEVDLPDDETATAVALTLSAGGNVRTTTMRAFDRTEIEAIIAKTS